MNDAAITESNRKNAFYVFLFSIISLWIFVISTITAMQFLQDFQGLLVGLGAAVLAVPMHLIGRRVRFFNIISFLLNSAANGFSASALYLCEELTIGLDEMLLAALPADVILLTVFLILRRHSRAKKATLITAAIIIIAAGIGSALVFIYYEIPIYSCLLFCFAIALIYICVFSVTINKPDAETLAEISAGSFGIFIIITLLVLALLSEFEIFDVADGIDDIPTEKAKKRKNTASVKK